MNISLHSQANKDETKIKSLTFSYATYSQGYHTWGESRDKKEKKKETFYS